MRTISYAVSILFLTCFPASGISSTTQVASEGQPISQVQVDHYGWPDGVIDLLNNPLRADGWNPWFSEWPNDVNVYEFKIRGSDDLDSIMRQLTQIHSGEIRIALNPASEPRSLGFTTVLPEGNDRAAAFSIGSQNLIDPWYLRLPESEPGVRTFGVHRYSECPKAMPPTLTLYVGHSAINLDELDIPADIEVTAQMSDSYREAHTDDAIVQNIEQFVKEHKRTRELAQTQKSEID